MGGKSTLHSAVLKDDTASVSSSFDLRSWQGLTQVLKVAKESLKEAGDYAEFRDLVLQYAQQGGDIELKKKIDAVIATFGKNESTVTEPEQIIDTTTSEKDDVTADTVESEPTAETVTKQTQVVQGGRRAKPVFHIPPAPEKTAPPVPSTVVEVREPNTTPPPDVSIPEVPIETPLPVVETVMPELEISAPKTLEEYKARITEIKRLVNDTVGNPASLMNSKDGHGKKYMSALLVALKATSAGGQGNVESALRDLENTFSLVIEEASVKEETTKKEDEQSIPSPIEPPPVVIPEVKEDEVQSIPTPPPVVTVDVVAPVKEPEAIQAPSVENDLVTVDEVPSAVVFEDTSPVEKIPDIPEEKVDVVIPPETAPAKVDVVVAVPEQPKHREAFQNSFQKTDDVISAVVSSVHKRKDRIDDNDPLATTLVDENDGYDKWSIPSGKVGQKSDLSKTVDTKHEGGVNAPDEGVSQKPLNTEAYQQQSELSSPETTALLNNLLQEWSIFSGSGLFGIGPDGLDHPLYVQLAPLTMGEVMAGRWEKVDPKILRIIKQYVDAWRHEQSITYTLNETFEHYLRRVVQRIQKRQTV